MTYILLISTIILFLSSVYLFYKYNQKKDLISVDDLRKKTKKIQAEFDSSLEEEIRQRAELIQAKLNNQNEIVLEKLKLQETNKIKKKSNDLEEEFENLSFNLKQKEHKLEASKVEFQDLKEDILKEYKQYKQDKEKEVKEYQEKLALVSGLTTQQAKSQLINELEVETGSDLLSWQQKKVENVKDNANAIAREIVAMAVQRTSSEVANEFTVVSVKIDDDDKGKIIGKKGRNIQWLEKTLGVEFVIDETPGAIVISGFNSIRRHIAKKTLEKLLDDGRIHPSSIEEMYLRSKSELAEEIARAGQETVEKLGIFDFPPKLIRLIGRLKFRTSYGQNMLTHSTEMSRLAKTIAQEMNQKFPHRNPIDPEICAKGALLHDIGKGLDEETDPKGDHVKIGEKICDSFSLDWKIKKCISSHHNEQYSDQEHGMCLEAIVVDACDNISGGRVGARKDSTESYYQRMESLENIAQNISGVKKAWIMRGSRELWVFFDTKKVSPSKMHKLVRKITKTIESNVTYPGEIKVVGLWEDTVVQYAK